MEEAIFYFTPAFILAMENAYLQTQGRTKEIEGEEKPILIKKNQMTHQIHQVENTQLDQTEEQPKWHRAKAPTSMASKKTCD